MEKGFKLASQLLTFLDAEQRWITLAEVEKSLGISDKTIRKMVILFTNVGRLSVEELAGAMFMI